MVTNQNQSFKEIASAYIKLIRIPHYIKNILVFFPLFFSGQILSAQKLFMNLLVFLSFCAVSSTVYVINDICDRKNDRYHPTKRDRPVASGAISVKAAITTACVLLLIFVVCCCITANSVSVLLMALYLFLNLGYSLGWKNIPLLDIVILVSGFVLRILCGAIVNGIVISNWLYLTVFVIALYLSLGKRRNELKKHSDTTRQVLKSYSEDFLDKSMTMCLTMTNIFYALWSMDVVGTSAVFGDNMIFTVPLVLLITLRYSMIVESDSDGDPVEVLLHDRILLLMCLVYAVAVSLLLYL